jgi:hypothetical protein
LAVGKDQLEALLAAGQALRAFRQADRAARTHCRNGVRSVLFSSGIWLVQWSHRAAVAPQRENGAVTRVTRGGCPHKCQATRELALFCGEGATASRRI